MLNVGTVHQVNVTRFPPASPIFPCLCVRSEPGRFGANRLFLGVLLRVHGPCRHGDGRGAMWTARQNAGRFPPPDHPRLDQRQPRVSANPVWPVNGDNLSLK